MDKDIKLALLGDHEAAKRLTDAGVLVPCRCGEVPTLFGDRFNTGSAELHCIVVCRCRSRTNMCNGRYAAMLEWNTRAPILSAEEMEMLHGKENP